jgi:hypothetical protein
MKDPMLTTLLEILGWDAPAPEILLEDDGDISLDWELDISVSINRAGGVSWATLGPSRHGTSLAELRAIVEAYVP